MVWSECKESHASCGTQCHFWPGGKEKFRQADSAESASLTLDCVYLSILRHRPQAKQDVRRNDLLVLMSGAHRGQVHSKGSCHRLISMPLWNGVEQIRICNGNIKVEGCHSLNAESPGLSLRLSIFFPSREPGGSTEGGAGAPVWPGPRTQGRHRQTPDPQLVWHPGSSWNGHCQGQRSVIGHRESCLEEKGQGKGLYIFLQHRLVFPPRDIELNISLKVHALRNVI